MTKLTSLAKAARVLKQHVGRADLNGDGKLTPTEARKYGQRIGQPKVGEALATMTSWAMHDGDGPAVRSVSLPAVKDRVDAALRVIGKKDVDGNGALTGSELKKAEKLETFKALAKLASSLELGR